MHVEKPGFRKKPGFSPIPAMLACKLNETETR